MHPTLRFLLVVLLALVLCSTAQQQQQLPLQVLATNVTSTSACNTGATPFILTSSFSCPLGFYCPNITEGKAATLPQMCTPSLDCQGRRLTGRFCSPQGVYEPVVCPQGYYCANFTTMAACPSRHFCRLGAYKPEKCSAISICGSDKQRDLSAIVSVIIIDVALIIGFILLRYVPCRKSGALIDTDKSVSMQKLKEGFERGKQSLNMHFSFQDLGYAIKVDKNKKKTILSGVTGAVQPGKVTAIMGPSGAGKTTFLSVLMGKVNRTFGDLKINGRVGEMQRYKQLIGYVPQEDIMLREMTVRENIAFSARTRLPSDWTTEQVNEYIDAIIDCLGLWEIQDSIIGDDLTRGISGGQRKRVNIAIELACVPVAIFLDEPTSGLDSTAALKVCDILSMISRLGVTVVAVLHQPRIEIFESFDDLLLLNPGGTTAYLGKQIDVIPHFQELGYEFRPGQNPADVLMDILSKKLSPGGKNNNLAKKKLGDLEMQVLEYDSENEGNDNKPAIVIEANAMNMEVTTGYEQSTPEMLFATNKKRGAHFWTQIYLCHNRYMIQQYRNVRDLILELFVGCLAGLLMGVAAMGNAGELYKGLLIAPFSLMSPASSEFFVPLIGLLIGLASGLSGAPSGVKVFSEEKVVYWREAACGHNRFCYYFGKTFASIYRILLSSLHFTALFAVFSSPATPLSKLFLLLFLEYYCVYALSTVVSMVVRRNNASLLAVVICMFAGVFCGFGPTLKSAKSWGLLWFWDISYNRWATEALYDQEASVYGNIFDIASSSATWGFKLNQFAFDMGMMFVIGSVLRVIGFVLMIILNRSKQR